MVRDRAEIAAPLESVRKDARVHVFDLAATGQAEVWHVLAIAAAISLVTGLDWPARAAIYPQFVEREAILSAVALNAFIWQSTRMAIPALGGIMIGFVNGVPAGCVVGRPAAGDGARR